MLKVINSGFYELNEPINSIEDAISLLGYKKMCNLAVGMDMLNQFPTEPGGSFDHAQFWQRAICSGVAAAETAQKLSSDIPADVFTVGLIQDVGVLFLVKYRPLEYGAALGAAKSNNVHMVVAEQDTIGVDHAKIGALLCRKWKLPKLLGDAVLSHHFYENKKTPAGGIKSILQILNFSSLLVSAMFDENTDEIVSELESRGNEFFGFDSDTVQALLASVAEPAKVVGEAFSIKVEPQVVEKPVPKSEEPVECRKCGHMNPAKTKFCGNCGAGLAEQKAPPINSNRILVAEDSIASRRALCFVIKKLGYIPIEATNGYEAVDQAKREPPGMIMMDIMMPAMSGIEALKKIRADEVLANVPIVMLTSLTDNETVIEAIQNGANDYIVKPYTAEIISDRVEKFMPKPEKKKRRRGRRSSS